MKVFATILVIVIIIVGAVWVWQSLVQNQAFRDTAAKIFTGVDSMIKTLKDKKIALIIAFRDFRDEEYFFTKQDLENEGAQITTVSSSLGSALGKMGGEVKVDVLLKDLKVDDYDAVLFIGGPGAYKYFDDPTCQKIAKETVEKNKVLGAICSAPAILAKAGVLKGKKATVWTSNMDKSLVKILQNGGAEYLDLIVVTDGKIVTANGPEASHEFVRAIIKAFQAVPTPNK